MKRKILNYIGIFATIAFMTMIVSVSDVHATEEGSSQLEVGTSNEQLMDEELSTEATLDEDTLTDESDAGIETDVETGGETDIDQETPEFIVGWSKIDGEWYYSKDGSAYNGWLKDNGYWYYFYDSWMVYDYYDAYIDGKYYGFGKDGHMLTGWSQFYFDAGTDEETGETWDAWTDWYYYNASGAMHRGWLQQGRTWYYLNEEYGYMYSDGIRNIGGTEYAFNISGAMITGWYEEKYPAGVDEETGETWEASSEWYYFNSSGAMHRGWLQQGRTWYYLDEEYGYMYSDGVWYVDEVLYGFSASGTLTSGWVYDTWYEEWYYVNKDGSVNKTGWIKDGGIWYYVEEGWMYYDGVYEINGVEHKFDLNGKWLGEV